MAMELCSSAFIDFLAAGSGLLIGVSGSSLVESELDLCWLRRVRVLRYAAAPRRRTGTCRSIFDVSVGALAAEGQILEGLPHQSRCHTVGGNASRSLLQGQSSGTIFDETPEVKGVHTTGDSSGIKIEPLSADANGGGAPKFDVTPVCGSNARGEAMINISD
ncbi:unnamed protein product [Urochloa humidicola]